ncbi:MAG: hypothetical protein AAGE84_02005 [Cyanobacteria bacterium P01_G01_bin.39]
MGKSKQRKAQKIIQDKVILAVGIVGSSILMIGSAVESFQTYRRNPTPQRILDIKPEIDRSWETLARSDDLAEKRAIIIDLEKKAQEQKLGVTRMTFWSLSHLSKLEQALSSPDDLSPDEFEQLLNSLDVSLWRIIKYSRFQKNSNIETSWFVSWTLSQGDFERDFERLHDFERLRYFEHDFERYFERYLFQDLEQLRYLERDFEQYLVQLRDFEQSLFQSQQSERDLKKLKLWYLEQDLVQYLEQYFLKQLILIKWYLWQIERGKVPVIPIEEISKQIISQSRKVYEQELAQSYGLKVDSESYTANQRQTKLITFISLASISTIGLTISALLLIQRRNQKITCNTISWCFVPEECVAELYELYEGLKAEEQAIWIINLIMLWNILVLLKSLYIQVAIENLFLPDKNQRD